jgi:hypothetical protein
MNEAVFKQPRWLYWVFAIGIASFLTRAVLDSDFRTSGLLYLGVPFLVAILVHQLLPRFSDEKPSRRVANHMRNATVVMLATSAILFEGFLCVLMFLPIYWFVTFIVFLARVSSENAEGKAKIGMQLLPFLIMIPALEGTSPQLSFPKDNVVSRSMIMNGDPSAIKAQLSRPIQFSENRDWFTGLFPLPDKVQTGTLQQGDIHKLHFTYRRWFFTNEQRGEMHVKLAEISDDHIRTEIIRNDSYLSHYLRIDGTDVHMEPIGKGQTRVTLTIRYSRLLDPAWYFGPMQEYAIEQSADYLLKNVIAPDGRDV